MSHDHEVKTKRPKGVETGAAEMEAEAVAADIPARRRYDEVTVQAVSQDDEAGPESAPPSFDPSEVSNDRLGPLSGQLLEQRYLIKEVIGAGGMGVVYRAEHTLMCKEMAVKVLLPEYGSIEGIKKRFHREAQSASRLDHPGIVHINDFGETTDGLLFIAMEFLDGESLTDLIRREAPLSIDRAMRIGLQLCLALDHAHQEGVVHRDLKPDNVILTTRGEHVDVVKVLDFGIAKITQGDGSSEALTEAGMTFGTPEYLSPEQAAGQPADTRSDLYSLGAILYELFTGTRPFSAPTKLELIGKHLSEPPTSMRKRTPMRNIPVELDDVVLHALAKKPDERIQSAAELFQKLSGIESVSTGPLPLWPANTLTLTTPAVPLPPRPGARRRLLLMGGLGGVVLAGIVTALALIYTGRLDDAGKKKEKSASTQTVLHKKAPSGSIQAVQQKLATNKVKDAKAILGRLADRYPTDSRVHLLTGHAHFLERKYFECLRKFTEAVRLDKSMKRNALVLEVEYTFLTYFKRRRGLKLRRKAMDFVERYLDAGAKDMVTRFVNMWWERELVWRGIAFLTKHGADNQVDWVHAYELVFRSERSCNKRKLYLKDVLRRQDPRFLPLLRKIAATRSWSAKNSRHRVSNRCILAEVNAAILVLEALESAPKTTPDSAMRPASGMPPAMSPEKWKK